MTKNEVTLEDYKGTEIEKAFGIDLEKGKKCSAKKKEMVDALMREGKDEDSAWAIATDKLGE